jgi:hypothetical protein
MGTPLVDRRGYLSPDPLSLQGERAGALPDDLSDSGKHLRHAF